MSIPEGKTVFLNHHVAKGGPQTMKLPQWKEDLIEDHVLWQLKIKLFKKGTHICILSYNPNHFLHRKVTFPKPAHICLTQCHSVIILISLYILKIYIYDLHIIQSLLTHYQCIYIFEEARYKTRHLWSHFVNVKLDSSCYSRSFS